MQSEDEWRLVASEVDGAPLILRIRSHPPLFASNASFPKVLRISWRYDSSVREGMPTDDDLDRMASFEDQLMPTFEEHEVGFLALIGTGIGTRQWLWYVSDADLVMKAINIALRDHPPFPVEFEVGDDPEWNNYSQFRAL